MAAVTLAVTLAISLGQNGPIKAKDVEYQNEVFQSWWEADLVWRFDDLPTKGSVRSFRVPYSGHDYPDTAGGTTRVLRKYDRAFHRGRSLATAFEQRDVTAFTEKTTEVRRGGLFGFRQYSVEVERTPDWHGHCNGWTAAAIRHAEPEHNVTHNGVTFTPADIKGMLAEIYMYRDNEFLGGAEPGINPGILHVVFTNWLGRGRHPIAMDNTLGKEIWNYPLYTFATSSLKHSDRRVQVKMNAYYTQSLRQEFDRPQHLKRLIYFHYDLTLDEDGAITGGEYYRDSARIDFLWAPLHPVQGGDEGNKRGNPHINVKEVLAIWRESVPEELRNKWYNIDPTEEDRILDEPPASERPEPEAADAEASSEESPAE